MPPSVINYARGKLFLGLVHAAEDNFHDMPAAGAGDVEGDRLAHYPFHDGSDHRIKVIEALIQQVKSFVQAVDFLA
jgi:hypothetical protein